MNLKKFHFVCYEFGTVDAESGENAAGRIQLASANSFTNLKNKFLGSSKSKVNLGLRLILC